MVCMFLYVYFYVETTFSCSQTLKTCNSVKILTPAFSHIVCVYEKVQREQERLLINKLKDFSTCWFCHRLVGKWVCWAWTIAVYKCSHITDLYGHLIGTIADIGLKNTEIGSLQWHDIYTRFCSNLGCSLFGYDTTYSCRWWPAFWRNIVSLSSALPLKC
jgi:hypothetical protein